MSWKTYGLIALGGLLGIVIHQNLPPKLKSIIG